MSRYDLVINGTEYSVDIVDMSSSTATVAVNGTSYHVELPAGVSVPASATAVAAGAAAPKSAPLAHVAPTPPKPVAKAPVAAGGEVISAPMPGHILNVLMSVGDTINVGDTLLVMEAMKMENEIRTHVAGTVQELKVSKGQDVGVGEVLAVIGG